MKKILLPLSIESLIGSLIIVLYMSSGVWLLIYASYYVLILKQYVIHSYNALMVIILGFFTSIYGAAGWICEWHNIIILDDDKITIKGHYWLFEKKKKQRKYIIQFPDEIKYSDIEDIAIIYADANSKKMKKYQGYSRYGSGKPYSYYEITLSNNKTKWIYLDCFSKKQREKMLNIINEKTGLDLSYETLERKKYSTYKKK